MERLANPYHKDKQTPIQMLLNRLKQQQIDSEQETVKGQVDKQYVMLRQGSRDVMNRRLHNDKVSGDTTNTTIDKSKPTSQPPQKQDFMKLKTQQDFMSEATKQYQKQKQDLKRDCFRGSMIACSQSQDNNPEMDKAETLKIASKLASDYNTKANDFNNKLKSQTKPNPLIQPTTSDYLVNPDTGVVVKNPVVQQLEKQQKEKDRQSELINSDAYKLAQEYKENREKSMKPKSNLINYGGMEITKVQYDYFEKLRKTNPTAYYQALVRLKTKLTTGKDLVIQPKPLDNKPTGDISVIAPSGVKIVANPDGSFTV